MTKRGERGSIQSWPPKLERPQRELGFPQHFILMVLLLILWWLYYLPLVRKLFNFFDPYHKRPSELGCTVVGSSMKQAKVESSEKKTSLLKGYSKRPFMFIFRSLWKRYRCPLWTTIWFVDQHYMTFFSEVPFGWAIKWWNDKRMQTITHVIWF